MGKKLYVGNLSYQVDSSELETLFGAHGTVVSAQIINDRDTGRSKGFGFVEMENDAEAQAAITALYDSEVMGRKIIVNESQPKQQGSGGGGFKKRSFGGDSGGGVDGLDLVADGGAGRGGHGARVDNAGLARRGPGEVAVERGLQAAHHAGVGGNEAELPVVVQRVA